jgi:hypothetical protein
MTRQSVFGLMLPALSCKPWMTAYHDAKAKESNHREEPSTWHEPVLFTGTKVQQTCREVLKPKAQHCKRVIRRTYFIHCSEHVWERYRNLSPGGAFCDRCQHGEKYIHMHHLNYSRLHTAERMSPLLLITIHQKQPDFPECVRTMTIHLGYVIPVTTPTSSNPDKINCPLYQMITSTDCMNQIFTHQPES